MLSNQCLIPLPEVRTNGLVPIVRHTRLRLSVKKVEGHVGLTIDLTDDSKDDVLDLSGEEERQAREEERRGVLTFHAEVERARADPALEYEAPPPGYDAPGLSRS